MDRIATYKKLVSKLIHDLAKTKQGMESTVQTLVIEDEPKGHYLLYNDGWCGTTRIYGCFLHIDVKDSGKVWLQRDGTDLEIALQLMDRGIPKQDIVLGFRPPIVRPETGFVVA